MVYLCFASLKLRQHIRAHLLFWMYTCSWHTTQQFFFSPSHFFIFQIYLTSCSPMLYTSLSSPPSSLNTLFLLCVSRSYKIPGEDYSPPLDEVVTIQQLEEVFARTQHSLFLSLTHTHTHTHTHAYTRAHTQHTHTPLLNTTHANALSHTQSRAQSHTHMR